MAKAVKPRKRERGNIELLPSSALRVRVYAGSDPVTGRRHNLTEVVPAGPKVWERAEDVKQGLLADVRARRNPKTTVTIDQLLDRYLDQHQGARTTVAGYRDYMDKHVRSSAARRSFTLTPRYSTPCTRSSADAGPTASVTPTRLHHRAPAP